MEEALGAQALLPGPVTPALAKPPARLLVFAERAGGVPIMSRWVKGPDIVSLKMQV